MNFKNIFYASMLSAVSALNGCKGTLPELQNPEVRQQFEGNYNGQMDGIPVTYSVQKDSCLFLAERKIPFQYGWEIRQLLIIDEDCDNTADAASDEFGFVRYRDYLLNHGTADRFDSLLKRGQELVRLENKVKE